MSEAIVNDFAEALGMKPRNSLNVPPGQIGHAYMGGNGIPYRVLDEPIPLGGQHYIPDGPAPDPSPSEPLVVGLTLRRIPDGGVLVSGLDGQVVFCCSTVEEACEYVEDALTV